MREITPHEIFAPFITHGPTQGASDNTQNTVSVGTTQNPTSTTCSDQGLPSQPSDYCGQGDRIENKRAAGYWNLYIYPDGSFAMVKGNPSTQPSWIVPGNFKLYCLNPLVSTNGESGYYRFAVGVNGIDKDIFLRKTEIGKKWYWMRKLNENGCIIPIQKIRDETVLLIMEKMMARNDYTLVIPSNIGWVISGDTYRFVEKGELLWAEVEENSK